jgi:predicted nucleic acid-binding protein
MKSLVIDASVVAAAFLPEEHTVEARKLLRSGCDFQAPDLIVPEFTHVLWKRVTRQEFAVHEALSLLDAFFRIPIRITPSSELAQSALGLAAQTGRTVYDSLYVALAVKLDVPALTADRKLVNALAATRYAEHVILLGGVQ